MRPRPKQKPWKLVRKHFVQYLRDNPYGQGECRDPGRCTIAWYLYRELEVRYPCVGPRYVSVRRAGYPTTLHELPPWAIKLVGQIDNRPGQRVRNDTVLKLMGESL